MKLTDFEGENIHTATGQLKMAIRRLNILDQVPPDIESKLLDIFQTSTIPDFNEFFRSLKLSQKHLLLLNPTAAFKPHLDVHAIITAAEAEYVDLCELGKWNGTNPPGSSFLIDGRKDDLDTTNEDDEKNLCSDNKKKWKTTPPPPGGALTMEKFGKTYYW